MKNVSLFTVRHCLTAALILISTSVFAQNNPVPSRHELNIGATTKAYNLSGAQDMFRPDILVVQAAYKYSLTPRFRIGFSSGANFYLKNNDITLIYCPDGGYHRSYTVHEDYVFAMATTQFNWVNKKLISVYSGIAGGLKYRHTLERNLSLGNADPSTDFVTMNKYNNFALAYQIDVLGIRIGNKIGGFAELGFGDKGYATAGVSLRF